MSFTRESSFYWGQRSYLSGAVKWVYMGMLGLLLLAFLGGRIVEDFRTDNRLLAAVDLAIAIPTLIFYWEYARSSIWFDKTEEIAGDRKGSKSGGCGAKKPHS